MRDFWKNAAVFGVSSLVALAGIEIGLRTIGRDLALGNHYSFYRFDPVLGWTNTPGEAGTYSRPEFTYPVSNNSLGMREAEIGDKQPGDKRVAVLGDSFVWGVGAADGQRFTEIVEKLDPSYDVLNFGVSGYGTVQQSLQLGQALALKPDAVVVALCLGNDLLDNVMPFRYGYHKPTAEIGPDGDPVISGHPLYESQSFGESLVGAFARIRIVGLIQQWQRRRAERAWMADNGRESRFTLTDAQMYVPDAALTEDERAQRAEAFEVAIGLLADMDRRVTEALGPDRFVVLFVPTKFEVGTAEQILPDAEPNRVADTIAAGLAAASVPFVDGRQVITAGDFWRNDGHWTPAGHEKIGTLLARDLDSRL